MILFNDVICINRTMFAENRVDLVCFTQLFHFQEGYKSVIRQFCDVIWKDGGVVRGISTLGTRQFPHYQDIRTESGIEKIWKGTSVLIQFDCLFYYSKLLILFVFTILRNCSGIFYFQRSKDNSLILLNSIDFYISNILLNTCFLGSSLLMQC